MIYKELTRNELYKLLDKKFTIDAIDEIINYFDGEMIELDVLGFRSDFREEEITDILSDNDLSIEDLRLGLTVDELREYTGVVSVTEIAKLTALDFYYEGGDELRELILDAVNDYLEDRTTVLARLDNTRFLYLAY